jgi:hypothetical protein
MSFIRPFELQSEGYNLSLEVMLQGENGKLLSFKDLLEGKESILIYRFSETQCDLCIIQHLTLLKKLLPNDNPDNLILLASYTNTKKIKILRETGSHKK